MLRVLTSIICVFLSSTSFAINLKNQHFLAVVDAGSTGSRVHVFSYDVAQYRYPVNIKEIYVKKLNLGIAAIKEDEVNKYLDTLFANAPIAPTPIYFYATAGMRLLPEHKQEALYQQINNWFGNHPQWILLDARTITGVEEGMYAWLAVNYNLGSLTQKDRPLVGVLDMGGASVQISFPVTTDVNDEVVEVDALGHSYKLFVHSFLGLGKSEVVHQFSDDENCFSNGYTLPNGHKALGDAYKCRADIDKLINHVHSVKKSVQPILQANPMHSWFVLGGLSYLAKDRMFVSENSMLTMNDVLTTGNIKACQQKWQLLHDSGKHNDYLHTLCMASSYYTALVADGYGISESQPINLLNDSESSDWTLGVVLQHK